MILIEYSKGKETIMPNLDKERIKMFYNSVANVWANNDPWHDYSQNVIKKYISKFDFFDDSIVLNAGSAGNTYGINCKTMYHIDIAEEKIKNIKNSYVASIEEMPFNDNFFDNIICVGSVLNYCDALNAISELSRVLKSEGNFILEFESSLGYEYIGTKHYKKDACIITTEYIEACHNQWLYSLKYIFKILKLYNLKIIEKQSFHIADGLLSKFLDDKTSVEYTQVIDNFLHHMPYFKNHGNNIILHCQKILL